MRIKPEIRFGETWGNIDDDGVLDSHWLATKLFDLSLLLFICSTSFYQ